MDLSANHRYAVRAMRLPESMTPEYRERLLAARWRHKNGIEHRALVALLFQPEALDRARARLRPDDFLTPAYAALAALLLGLRADEPALEAARQALTERPYLPEERVLARQADELVAELCARRERWRVGRGRPRRGNPL